MTNEKKVKNLNKAIKKIEKILATFVGQDEYDMLDLVYPEVEMMPRKKLNKFIKKYAHEMQELNMNIFKVFLSYDLPMLFDKDLKWICDSETELGDFIDVIIEQAHEKGIII